MLVQLSKYPAAEKEARTSIIIKPNEAQYHRLLADALAGQGKNEDAWYEYRRAQEINPNSSDAGDIKSKIDHIRQMLGLH